MRTLYHERQVRKLCALHCVNAVLQAPVFSEFDLVDIAADLDQAERQMMLDAASGDFVPEVSHNVSLNGDFSIQVLTKALGLWDFQVIPLDNPVARAAQVNPDVEIAYICNLHDHWFCLRKVDNQWYNFDSMQAAPEHLSTFRLSLNIDSLKASGWSIFIVRGDYTRECTVSELNKYGRWLTPQDAKRIFTSSITRKRGRAGRPKRCPDIGLSDDDDEDGALRHAIAVSLKESGTSDKKQPDGSEDENVEKVQKKSRVEG